MKWLGLLKFIPRLLTATKDIRTKGWYASRTVWFNVLVLGADVSAQVFQYVLPVTHDEINSIAVAIAAIGNIYLRTVTTTPVGARTVREITDDALVTGNRSAPVERLSATPIQLPPIELQSRSEPAAQPSSAADLGFQNR